MGQYALVPVGISKTEKISWHWSQARKLYRRTGNLFPLDTVIAHANTLGGNQPNLITFTDKHGRHNGDVETTGMGANSYEVEV